MFKSKTNSRQILIAICENITFTVDFTLFREMTNIIESTWLNRAHYEGAMDRFQTLKAKRKRKRQNLILFFEENNDVNDQGSKLVRHYMNRSVIAEEDQCEISEIYSLSKTEEIAQLNDSHHGKSNLHTFIQKDTDRDHNDETNSNMIRQWMNQYVIVENDRFEITRSEYHKNGKRHTFIQTDLDLNNIWQQPDKQNHVESLFELLISKLIKSEHARVREQHWFQEWREKIQDNVERDNWSDNKWLNAGFIQSVESKEYINHFVISHLYSSKAQHYFLKAIIQNSFQKAVSMLKNKQDYEEIELTYASDLIEYSTMVTVLSGYSKGFLTKARLQQNLIGDDLDDFHNMTATDLFWNDELKNLNLYKLIAYSKFKSNENESELSEFIFKKQRKQYIQCQRFSFPMARIPLRSPKKPLDGNVEYYLYLEEVERAHHDEIKPNMICQWINEFAIVEEDQFEITCLDSDCQANVENLVITRPQQFKLSNNSLSMRSIMNLVTRSFGSWPLFGTSGSDSYRYCDYYRYRNYYRHCCRYCYHHCDHPFQQHMRCYF